MERKTVHDAEEISVERVAKSLVDTEDIDSVPDMRKLKRGPNEYLINKIHTRLLKRKSRNPGSLKVAISFDIIWTRIAAAGLTSSVLTESVHQGVWRVRALAPRVEYTGLSLRECAKELIRELEDRIDLVLDKIGNEDWDDLTASCDIEYDAKMERVLQCENQKVVTMNHGYGQGMSQRRGYEYGPSYTTVMTDLGRSESYIPYESIPLTNEHARSPEPPERKPSVIGPIVVSFLTKLVRTFAPKKWADRDTEGGSELPKAVTALISWWAFYGKKLVYALTTALTMILLYRFVALPIINKQPDPVHLDRRGGHVINVPNEFGMYHDVEDWISGIPLPDRVNPLLSEDEISTGYFNATVRGSTERNVTIESLSKWMEISCKRENCRCISAGHAGIVKNILYVHPDSEEEKGLFMINPVVTNLGDMIRVGYKSPSTIQAPPTTERWTTAPSAMTVEYRTIDDKILTKMLREKGSACVYKCIKWLDVPKERDVIWGT